MSTIPGREGSAAAPTAPRSTKDAAADGGDRPPGRDPELHHNLAALDAVARQLLARYGLLIVWALMALGFTIAMPDVFGTVGAFRAIFGSQQTLLFLSLAALCGLVVGEFDLSIAAIMGISATIIPVMVGIHGQSVVVACAVAMAVSALCGAVNALFVIVVKVPSLVVTLGMGTLLLGIAQFISGANAVSLSSVGFNRISTYPVLGMPVSFWYGLAVVALFAYVMGWTPLGRHILFVGASREVARLAGIRVQRIRFGSYVAAALFAGAAGLLLVATNGGFDSNESTAYLLPAIAAVFLSTAVVQPGQFNPIGTLIGIYFLETGIFGLQLMGLSSWIQDVFYGGGLVAAVAIATVVRSRATRAA